MHSRFQGTGCRIPKYPSSPDLSQWKCCALVYRGLGPCVSSTASSSRPLLTVATATYNALNMLGYNSYHAMEEGLQNENNAHIKRWNEAIEAKYYGRETGHMKTAKDFDEVLWSYTVCTRRCRSSTRVRTQQPCFNSWPRSDYSSSLLGF